MHDVSSDSIKSLQQELLSVRSEMNSKRLDLLQDFQTMSQTWNALEMETKNRERELIQRLTVDHELEMNDIRKILLGKEDEIQMLLNDKTSIEATRIDEITQHENEKCVLRDSVEKLQEEMVLLKQEMDKTVGAKDQAMREARENLLREHKLEIESVKSRLKLMASVDRSPSDTSLEKIERPDMIDIVNHEMIVAQIKDDMLKEKDKAVQVAIENERTKAQISLAESPKSLTTASQDFYKRILDEKDHQIEMLRERDNILTKENIRIRDAMQAMLDSDGSAQEMTILQERVSTLLQDKERLKNELKKERQKRAKSDALQSSKHSSLSIIESCSVGDTVTIIWSPKHEQFLIVQDSPTLYFLHAESNEELGLLVLKEPGALPNILHTFGVVTKKDYCRARKDENRYKVSKGTQFYVIRCRPRQRREGTIHRFLSAQLMDSFAQTDLEPLFEQGNDMVDSGVSEQQKSTYKERTGSTETAEEITDEIESSSGGGGLAKHDNVLDDTEEVCIIF